MAHHLARPTAPDRREALIRKGIRQAWRCRDRLCTSTLAACVVRSSLDGEERVPARLLSLLCRVIASTDPFFTTFDTIAFVNRTLRTNAY